MDTFTFVAELVKAGAWPIITIAVAILFRKELRVLLGRFKKGKVGSAEFEFQEEVKDVAEYLPVSRPVALKPEVVSLAVLHPRAALLKAWFEIEFALINLAQKHELLTDETRRNPSALIRALTKADLIPRAYGPAFHALHRLRNQAAYEMDFSPSEEATLGYLRLAEELKQLVLEAENAR
ncbi:MAG: hypothetical protein ACREV3_04545 [Gammaproteobacteria bacterium]